MLRPFTDVDRAPFYELNAHPEVVAVVQLGEGSDTTGDSIVDHASAHIARYKLPKEVVFVERIQRSPSGKADYRWAAETAVKGASGA